MYRRLAVANEPDALLHDRANVEAVREACIRCNEANAAHLAHGQDAFVNDLRHIGLEHERLLDFVQHGLRLVESTAVERDVESAGHELLDLARNVLDLGKVDHVDAELGPCHLKTLRYTVDANNLLRALELSPFRGIEANGTKTLRRSEGE